MRIPNPIREDVQAWADWHEEHEKLAYGGTDAFNHLDPREAERILWGGEQPLTPRAVDPAASLAGGE